MSSSPRRTDARTPLMRTAASIGLLFAIGTVGYFVIGQGTVSPVDALYMTVITLTTVGYGEVVDLSGNPAGRLFTMALLLIGVGTFIYFVSNLTAFMVEGNLEKILWSRRMKNKIGKLKGHTIVCGGGHTGEAVLRELLETERPFVLVEHDPARVAQLVALTGVEFPVVIGDATEDECLERAKIGEAEGLVATISNDKDNLIVTVSARLLNDDLRIIARCIDKKVGDKLMKAGANAVVSPNLIGGLRMVSELVRPAAVSFLDLMLRDKDRRLRVEEVTVRHGSPLVGRTLGDLEATASRDVLVVALRQQDGAWVYNPEDATPLHAGMALVLIGSPAGRRLVEAEAMP
ncbi:MAG: potassium channel protein [Myxococcales bacterium]|nr:potassium channel protein [Myxococcales bacterium]